MRSPNAKTSPLVPRVIDSRQGSLEGILEPLAALLQLPEGDFTAVALQASARKLLAEAGCPALAMKVRVQWNYRLRTTAGLACASTQLVSLNPRLIAFGMPEVDRTLRHELAHLLARYRAGFRHIEPHGAEWRQACADLGLPDEKRCHDLPLPRRRMQAKHLYRCQHCRTDVWRVRPFRRAVACLKCCRAYNGGKYHDRFRLVKAPVSQP